MKGLHVVIAVVVFSSLCTVFCDGKQKQPYPKSSKLYLEWQELVFKSNILGSVCGSVAITEVWDHLTGDQTKDCDFVTDEERALLLSDIGCPVKKVEMIQDIVCQGDPKVNLELVEADINSGVNLYSGVIIMTTVLMGVVCVVLV